MKKLALFFLCFILAFSQLFLSSCSASASDPDNSPSPFTYERRDETGYFFFSLFPAGADGKVFSDSDLESFCIEALNAFDEAYYSLSPLNPASDISKINSDAGTILGIDASVCKAINEAFALSDATGGLFLPANGAAFELLSSENEVSDEALTNAIALGGCDKFIIGEDSCEKANTGAKLYFDTFARARAFEIALNSIKERGIAYGILSLDGLVGVFGEKKGGEAFLIDVLSPDSRETIGSFSITEGYISVSHENFSPLYDIAAKDTKKAGELCAIYSADAITCSVLSHIGYANGFENITSLYPSEALSFEGIYDGEDSLKKTDGLGEEMFCEPVSPETVSSN